MRIGEVLALTWEDVNFSKKTISIYKSTYRVKNTDENSQLKWKMELSSTKTASGNRTIYLPNRAVEMLTMI
ncbi:hypothetical protein FACS1894188_05670 [Clostridia bacterium]|nr:hypothetical protein FACS1894188_05670 [Clostridia bacterium]